MTQTIKHAIIACHPLKKSFTLSVAERYAETVRSHGHEVVFRDLYRVGFNPSSRPRKGQDVLPPDIVEGMGHARKA